MTEFFGSRHYLQTSNHKRHCAEYYYDVQLACPLTLLVLCLAVHC